MTIRHQWVKFSDVARFQSTDYSPGVWVLAEIDDDYPDGGVTLFGVEYCMRQSEIAEWGAEVSPPKSN